MHLMSRIAIIVLCLTVLAIVDILVAMSLPRSEPSISIRNGALVIAAQTAPEPILNFRRDGTDIAATPDLLIREPDVLTDFAEYNDLLARHEWLWQAGSHQLKIVTAAGEQTLSITSRQLIQLPFPYWFQIVCGYVGALAGALVLASRPSIASALYAITGLCLALAAGSAAIYSTREFLIRPELWHTLKTINYAGTVGFSAALASLLWVYPLQLARPATIITLCFAAAAASVVSLHYQWVAGPSQLYVHTLGLYVLSFLFAALQWRKTRRAPMQRAILRWMLLSIFVATGLFAALAMIPAALGLSHMLPQEYLFAVFLIMFLGLALGITRYQLFDVERWWITIWSWVLGGLCVIALDVFLVSQFALSRHVALPLSLALIGWGYFPARQWLWKSMTQGSESSMEELLVKIMPSFIDIRSDHELDALWRNVMADYFTPLQVETIPGLEIAAIGSNGESLDIPHYEPSKAGLRIHHPVKGRRLFSRSALQSLQVINSQFSIARSALSARQQGREAERKRIRRDIHDDLGARLLTLLHRCDESERPLVRQAIVDLRELLRSMEAEPQPLTDLLRTWAGEVETRCEAAGVPLRWNVNPFSENPNLSPEQQHNLSRIIRESTSNALRHAHPSHIEIDITFERNRLKITVINDGAKPANEPRGRGLQIMQNRAEEIGGALHWQSGDCWQVECEIPLQPRP